MATTQFWDQLFAQTDSFRESPNLTDPVLNAALTFFGEVKGKRILDLGCGSGSASLFFAQAGAEVVSLDSSAVAIDQFRRFCLDHDLSMIQPVHRSALEISQLDPVDYVFGSMILHHLDPFESFVSALRQSLTPSGKAFFWENNANNPILMWTRQHLLGRWGIPKYGDAEEFPLTSQEVNLLKQQFSVEIVYPELLFFRLASIYLLKGKMMKPLEILDQAFFQLLWFRQFSYRQYLYISTASDPADPGIV